MATGSAKKFDPLNLRIAPVRYAMAPALFWDEQMPRNQKGEHWSLAAHQRWLLDVAFRFERVRGVWRLALRTFIYSTIKKSGKTSFAAGLLVWWCATRARTEVLCLANDKEQAASRVFQVATSLVKLNELEKNGYARCYADRIVFASGTTLRALASGDADNAGSEHSVASFDEIWAFNSERARRLWEELTPINTEPQAFNLVTSYAGYENERGLLGDLFDRAMAAERVGADLPVFSDNGGAFVAYWDSGLEARRMPWQQGEEGAAYYDEQRRILRPNQFDRLHLNLWTSSESAFISPEAYDACVDADLRSIEADRELPVFVGVDLAAKNDTMACVVVAWVGRRLRVVDHRVWRPRRGEPLHFESTIVAFLREVDRRFSVESVSIDPWQAYSIVQRLQAEGIPMKETPFTSANTTQMASVLGDVINSRTLWAYADDDVRSAVLAAVVAESEHGMKLKKPKASKKVDACIALALAAQAAVADAELPPLMLASAAPEEGTAYHDWLKARGSLPPEEDEGGEVIDEKAFARLSPEEQAEYEPVPEEAQ